MTFSEPPWWPNNLIRWVDMVDLRGKPPYLPDTKSYTDVLKIAIANSYAYYGYDSENYLDIFTDPNAGLLGEKQKMFPLIPAAGIAPPPPPKVSYSIVRHKDLAWPDIFSIASLTLIQPGSPVCEPWR